MREIKFRAWDKEDHKLRSVAMLELSGSQRKVLMFGGKMRWSKNVELMQYTGLKDKNGVEIYEGDILRGELSTINPDEPQVTHGIAVVVWYQENLEYILVDADEYNNGVFDEPTYMLDDRQGWVALEVIGNIYENKELLNG